MTNFELASIVSLVSKLVVCSHNLMDHQLTLTDPKLSNVVTLTDCSTKLSPETLSIASEGSVLKYEWAVVVSHVLEKTVRQWDKIGPDSWKSMKAI